MDELLKEAVLESLVKDTTNGNKQLFSNNGPLSSFSSRIDISYRFGIISKYEKSQLHALRNIRNVFAHMLVGASFENESVKQKTLNTSVPIQMLNPINIPRPQYDGDIPALPIIEKASENNPRAIFQETVIHLSLLLSARLIQRFSTPMQEANPFAQATEPGEMILEYSKTLRLRYDKVREELLEKGGTEELLEKGVTVDGDDQRAVKKVDSLIWVQNFVNEQTKKAHAAKNYA